MGEYKVGTLVWRGDVYELYRGGEPDAQRDADDLKELAEYVEHNPDVSGLVFRSLLRVVKSNVPQPPAAEDEAFDGYRLRFEAATPADLAAVVEANRKRRLVAKVEDPNPPAPETGIDDEVDEAWQAMHRSPGFAPSDVVRAGMEKAAHEAEAAPPTLVVVNPAATAPGSYADLGRLAGADQPRAEDSP